MNEGDIIGNAQTIGCGCYQTNYFLTEYRKNGILAVLADATPDCVNAVRASVIACEVVKNEFLKGSSLKECCLLSAKVLRERIYKGRMPCVTLSAVWIENDIASFIQIGDNSLYFYAGKELHKIQKQYGEHVLEKQDCMILCSQGVANAVNEVKLVHLLDQYDTNHKRAEAILQEVIKKSRSDQENATVLVVSPA